MEISNEKLNAERAAIKDGLTRLDEIRRHL
jgi:hypothetical protein